MWECLKLKRWISLFVLVGVCGFGWGMVQSWAAEPRQPESPRAYVVDEAHVLQSKTVRALHRLLHEHDQLTGEQMVIAVFQDLQGQDIVQWTNQIFQKWGLGQKGKDNGVLLALFWKDRQMRLEVGYGLEAELTDAQSKLILADYLKPMLKAGHPDEGLTAAAMQILSVLESPLIENGKALEILKGEGFSQEQLDPESYSSGGMGYVVVLLILILLGLAYLSFGRRSLGEDGRYGSLVIPPFLGQRFRRGDRSKWDDFFGGGGGSGGGDGPFSGGGGSSGGGGASDRW